MRLFKIDSTSENTRENYLFKLAITAHIYVVLSAKYFPHLKCFVYKGRARL